MGRIDQQEKLGLGLVDIDGSHGREGDIYPC
jgi:hypothetical protein